MERTGRSKEAVERLGYMPTSLRKRKCLEYFDRYDQIAIVDSDIHIKSHVPTFSRFTHQSMILVALLKENYPIKSKYKNKITKYSRSAFTNLKDVDWKWNNPRC